MRALAVAALVCAGTGAISGGQEARSDVGPVTRADPPIARKVDLKGVSNFGEVSGQLYRGAQPTAHGFEELAHRGVGIVIDLRGDDKVERDVVTKLGMHYVAIPWHCYAPKDEKVAKFLSVLRDHPDKKVFVHCRLGIDRTGLMVASYRMAEQGWSAEQAEREMMAFGFNSAHRMICPGLSSYEEKFPSRFASGAAFEELRPSHPPSTQQP
jgi:protein tyrosine phosphatase (PTP) superfamily phosphohydrolase (DUF442 family)